MAEDPKFVASAGPASAEDREPETREPVDDYPSTKPDGGSIDTTTMEGWKEAARKWESEARKLAKASPDAKDLKDLHGLRAKAKEYDKIVAANQTAQEKAETAAKAAEDRAAAAVRRVASAEIRAALTGVVPDPAAVAEDLDIGRFIDESGDVKPDAVKALREKYAALAPPSGPRPPAPNPAQGSGGKAKSLGELIADAEKASTGTRQDTRSILGLKSRMLLNQDKG